MTIKEETAKQIEYSQGFQLPYFMTDRCKRKEKLINEAGRSDTARLIANMKER